MEVLVKPTSESIFPTECNPNSLPMPQAEKKLADRDRQLQYVAFLQHQIELKNTRRNAMASAALQDDAVHLGALAGREAMFEQYADTCTKAWQEQGKDVTPARLYLRQHRKPALLAST